MPKRTRRKSRRPRRKSRKKGKRSKLCNCKVCGCKRTCRCRSLQKGGYWSFNPLNWGKKKPVAEVEPGPVGQEPVQLEVVEPVQSAVLPNEKPETVGDAVEKGQQKIADKMNQKAADAQEAMANMAVDAQKQAADTVNAGVAALLGEGDKKEDDKLVAEPGMEVVVGGRRRRRKSTKKKKKRRKKKTKRRRRKGSKAGVMTPSHTTGGPFPIWIDSPSPVNKAPMPGGRRKRRRRRR
mgnify:CR=1 FL=1